MIGEAEFAVAPVLWNRIRELPQQDPGRALLARCGDFSAAAGLDAEAARQWSLAREVENALWYASQRHHDGDLARSLWVASTLAGRTLPGLPAPQELPAPGEAGRDGRRLAPHGRQRVADGVDGDSDIGVVRAPVAHRNPQDIAVLPA